MASINQDQLDRIDQQVIRLGLPLVEAGARQLAELQAIRCFGYPLPLAFTWFCARYPAHSGWPHNGWPGLFSPLELEIDKHNAWRRENRYWPPTLVSFFSTDDGDYCFDYGTGTPQVVYVDDWANPPAEDEGEAKIHPTFVSASFEDWLEQQVDWLLKQLERPADR